MVVTLFAMCLVVAGFARTTKAAESDTLKPTTVPAAAISIGVPEPWLVVDLPSSIPAMRAYLKKYPEMARILGLDANASDKDLKRFAAKMRAKTNLFAANPDNGDNVIVGIEHGPWWDNFDDWKSIGKQSADATHATVLSDDETRIGSRQAFMHLEQDPPQGGGVIFGYMEIKAGKNRSISISITVDGANRATAESILRSVVPA
jgi:hypothetical protein